jgi:Mg2+/citrate symporter
MVLLRNIIGISTKMVPRLILLIEININNGEYSKEGFYWECILYLFVCTCLAILKSMKFTNYLDICNSVECQLHGIGG